MGHYDSMSVMKEKRNENEHARFVDELFTRGVGTFVDPKDAFKKKLLAKIKGEYPKDIIVKFGVDPTRPDIHLGHAVVLRKLRQLQDLGCKVVFLVGDITASIGDPTGKSKMRPEMKTNDAEKGSGFVTATQKLLYINHDAPLREKDDKEDTVREPATSSQEVVENMKTYLEQVGKILSTENNVFSWIKNSDWFLDPTDIIPNPGARTTISVVDNNTKKSQKIAINPNSLIGKIILYQENSMQLKKLGKTEIARTTLMGLLWTLRHITVAQLLERDMFAERLKKSESIFLHEMLYPVIQGIDSYSLAKIYGSCDLEVGGTDQTFNMLMGRKVMEVNKQEPQAVLSFNILVGTDGKEKMSKSLDNYVGITDEPKLMFGKLMSIPDSVIPTYFELCTFTPVDGIEEIRKKLKGGKVNPRDIKMDLARQIVAIYHGEKKSEEAKATFIATFKEKKLPDDMPTAKAAKGTLLVDVLIREDVIDSKSEFRRLLGEGAIRKDGEEKLSDTTMKLTETIVLRVGKHRFIRIVVE